MRQMWEGRHVGWLRLCCKMAMGRQSRMERAGLSGGGGWWKRGRSPSSGGCVKYHHLRVSFPLSEVQFPLCGMKGPNSTAVKLCPKEPSVLRRGLVTWFPQSGPQGFAYQLLNWGGDPGTPWSGNGGVKQRGESRPVIRSRKWPRSIQRWKPLENPNDENQRLSEFSTSVFLYCLNYRGPQRAILCVASKHIYHIYQIKTKDFNIYILI